MTWKRLQSLTDALLIGDMVLVDDAEQRIALLEYAFEEIVQNSDVLTLEVADDITDMAREGVNGINLRRAVLPTDDDSIIDLDTPLCFVAARLIASYVSKNKFEYHRALAFKDMESYSVKVTRAREKRSKFTDYGERNYMDKING